MKSNHQRVSSSPQSRFRAERAREFSANVRRLLESECLSQRQAAEEICISYKWLRRLCHHGLVSSDKRTAKALERFAAYFGLETEDLWNQCLPCPQVPSNFVLIKWMGSKRKQAEEILRRFPKSIETYYEPFLGGGSVFLKLLSSDIRIKRYRCSDLCGPLIGIWNLILKDPRLLSSSYEEMRSHLKDGGKRYYLSVRERFNESRSPCDFFFLLRTCRIGLVKFNRLGHFSTAYHLGEDGLDSQFVRRIIFDTNRRMRDVDVQFLVRDFARVRTRKDDFLYLDPPYKLRKQRLYLAREFDHDGMFKWLSHQKCPYALSLNGFFGDEDRRVEVPNTLYDEEIFISNGDSAMSRMVGKVPVRLKDCLYLRAK